MKRVFERVLSFLLAAALLANAAPWACAVEREEPDSVAPITELPAEEEEVPVQLLAETLTTADGYVYTVADSAVTITGYTGDATELVIPAEIDGLPVTTIGAYAFSGQNTLTEIVIPEGVTTLHNFCFAYMDETELTVHIPTTLTEFKGGYGAFYGSTVKEVVFADGITHILTRLFDGAHFRGALTIPDTVTTIGQSAFAETTGLTAVTLPEGLTEIAQGVFFDSRDLASVTIPDTVTVIRSNAFDGAGLTSIDLPENLVEIGPYAFSNCEKLTEITIPEGVTTLHNFCFAYMDKTELTVHIPTTLTEFKGGYGAFYGSTVKEVVFADGITHILTRLFDGAHFRGALTIPDTVTSIGQNAFAETSGLTAVTLPEGLTEIDQGVFFDSRDLASVSIPDTVTVIRSNAFDSAGLTSIDLPENLVEIGPYAFSNCEKLTEITIPEGVTTLHNFCFAYMDETELTVHIPTTLTEFKGGYGAFYGSTVKEVVFADGITHILTRLFDGANFRGALTIPDTVTTIGQNAFAETSGLTAVTLPEGLTEIAQGVFFDSRDLASVTIPDTVTVIRSNAFDSAGLTSIDLPDDLVEIGPYAFSNCEKLTEITIPEGVTTLHNFCFAYMDETELTVHIPTTLTEFKGGYGAFYGSTVKEVVFADGITHILTRLFDGAHFRGALTIPDTVTTIGQNAFAETSGLTAVTLPEGLTEIAQGVFFDSRDLASVTIPDTVSVIRSNAFDSAGLTSIDLPDDLVEIGPYAFSNCDNLKDVVLPDALTILGNYAFAYCDNLEALITAGTDIQIGWDILYNSSNTTVVASDRSALAVYAVENGNPLSLFPGTGPHTLLTDHSTYLVNTATAIGGNYLGATVKYSFQNPEEISWARLELMIPATTLLSENSVSVNGERVLYDEGNNGVLNIDVPTEGGRVELSLRISGPGDIQTYAVMHTDLGSEILRVISEPLPEVILSVPERIHTSTVKVTGFARPDAEVDLYVDGQLQKTVPANKAGTYSETLTLPVKDPELYQIFDIKAQSGDSYAVSQLRYSKDTPQLVEFLMYYNNHQNTVMDLLNQTKRPHISFNPAYDITLTARFKNGGSIDKVWFTTSRGGVTNAIPATFDGERYVAVLTRDDYNGTPGTLGVEYSLKRDLTGKLADAEKALNNAVEASKGLLNSDNTEIRELDKNEIEVPDGLILEQAQEAEVDLGTVLGVESLSVLLQVGKFSVRDKNQYPDGYLHSSTITAQNPNIPIAGIPSLGVIGSLRVSGGPQKPYAPAASSSDGFHCFSVRDSEGNTYNIMYKASGSEALDEQIDTFVCFVENVSTSEVFKYVMEAGANTPQGIETVLGALENVNAFGETVGIIHDLYEIDRDDQDLKDRIRKNLHGEEQKEALKKADELRHNRQDFTLAMAVIGGGLSMMGYMSGPPGWAMMAIMFAMSASSEFFWESRTNNILGGIFGADYIIDPSGYVYEAVTTNRVEGVKATALWIPEPETGLDTFYANVPVGDDARQVVWDAEAYDQMNPLYTDSNGAYAWDVPAGWWRVMYEKDGYETTYSEWLPVPPPQLEVNVSITSYEAPAIEAVKAETGSVEVTFSKYMKPDTVALTLNGQAAEVSCTIEEGYARTFTLTPAEALVEGDMVTVTVAAGAESYAGTAAEDGSVTAKVGGAPRLELQSGIQILYGGEAVLPFTVKNVENAVVTVDSVKLATEVTLHEDGTGGFVTIHGDLPGYAAVTVSVEGTDLSQTVEVSVVRELTEPEILSPTWENGSLTVTVTTHQTATVTAAVYGPGGQFVGLVQAPVGVGENQDITISGLPGGESCKVFLLDDDHIPLCQAETAAK